MVLSLFVLAELFVAVSMAAFGCDYEQPFPVSMIDKALHDFYHNTKGPTNWPKQFTHGWEKEDKCAWDGNEWGHLPPAGMRCLNGGWHQLPPKSDGGLLFLEHFSGAAEGPVPPEFKACMMTDSISFAHNKLNGPIWNTSFHCFLHKLDLSHNQFSGTLGDDFMRANYLHAEIINLGSNGFEGPIPAMIGTLQPLTALLLNDNKFSGSIPDLSQNKQLRHLNLARNQLSGTIGQWMKEMTHLSWVQLDDNKLEGSLPDLPPSVSTFSASGNRFSGKIPASYGQPSHLRTFNCSGCQLECPSPDFLARLPFTTHCKQGSRKWD